jgi:hypothetical protein
LGGKSVDTTMGLTPLEGLVMGTRSGDIDPGLHAHLQKQLGWTLDQITDVLNSGSSGFFVGGIVTLIQICVRSANFLSDSDIPRAKAPRTPSSEIYFPSLPPLRLCGK